MVNAFRRYAELLAPLAPVAQNNYPGICSVMAINKEAVTSLLPSLIDILQLLPGNYPLQIARDVNVKWLPVCQLFNAQMHMIETEKADVQGSVFTYTLTFDLNNDNYRSRGAIIQAFDRREWILKVTERSGAIRLLGGPARGADFSAQLNTGSVFNGANLLACGFKWQTGERAFYVGTSIQLIATHPLHAPGNSNYAVNIQDGSGVNSINMQYSTDGGATWIDIAGGTATNQPDGDVFIDDIPNPISATVLVRVLIIVNGVNYISDTTSYTWP